jgi:hypothetical protein
MVRLNAAEASFIGEAAMRYGLEAEAMVGKKLSKA